MFFSIFLLFTVINCVYSFTPSCQSCKFYISNDKNEDLGLCNMFQDAVYHNNIKTLQKNLAIHCRSDENLCGEPAFLHEPVDDDKEVNANTEKKFEHYEYIKKLCADDFIEETNLEELEKIEKDLVDVFQKMRRHNLRTIYNTPKSISKLFKKLKE
jgi:hypothetical protein